MIINSKQSTRQCARIWSDDLQLPCVQPSTSSWSPSHNGRHDRDGRHGHGGHVYHGNHGGHGGHRHGPDRQHCHLNLRSG